MALTEFEIRSARATEKPIKLFDGDGLHLSVQPNGNRWWFKRHEEARRTVAQGIDPSAERKAAKEARQVTFELIAEEWLALQAKKLATVTYDKARWMLSSFIYPRLGSQPIAEITAPELLAALRVIEARGTHETAHRTKQRVGQVFRYAIATGRAERDISADLRGALAPVATKNHAALTDPIAIGHPLRAIGAYSGQPVTHAALKLAPLVFVRPGELRQAEWTEINLDGAEWRTPAERMKMRETHVVPLSKQAVDILRDVLPLTGSSRYVFPSLRTKDRPMSENTINAAQRRLGYGSRQASCRIYGLSHAARFCLMFSVRSVSPGVTV